MSIAGSIVQGSGGGGVSDIKDTYKTLDAQTGDYTVIDTGSTVIPVATNGGSLTITLDETIAEIGARFRIQDVGGYCATNPAYVEDSEANALQRVDTNDGAVEYVWTGLSWQIIDKFENMWDRNPATGEITPASEDDVIVAGMMRAQSATATTVEKTVEDATNIGTNVDQNGTSDFGNAIAVSADPFNQGNYQTSDSTPYIISCFPASIVNLPYIAFDGILNLGTTRVTIPHGGGECWIRIDTGTPRMIGATKVKFKYGITQGFSTEWRIQGSNDNSNWDTLYFSNGSANDDLKVTFDNIGSYRYYRWQADSGFYDASISIVEIYLYGADYATTDNTSDLSIPVGTYSAASIVYYDETGTLISGSGKINVAYEVDGGGFNTIEDQTVFQARSEITSTTAFKIRTQAVGAQRWSRLEIQTSTTYVNVNNGGIDVNISGAPVASLGSVFKCPKMTEATRDSLTPAEGWIIYNSTTNKLNVYTGSAWEVITSA